MDDSPQVRAAHQDESVAEFGYKQEMKREASAFKSFAVAFGFVSIATGIFTTFASVMSTSGPAGIWTWPIVVLGQLMVAFIFGSLAARIPVSGYAYQWTSRLANPIWGWIMGWISFAFLGIVVVAVDYTIAGAVLPVLFGYQGTAENCWLITAIVILIQAVLVTTSTRTTLRVNGVAVMLQLIGMCSLVVLLFVVGAATKVIDFSHLFNTAGAEPYTMSYLSFGTLTNAGPWCLGFMLGAFTIVGFESAANLAEETKDPARTVPRAMWQAVASLGIIGFLFIVAVTATGDYATLHGENPVAQVITNVLGSVVGKGLLVLVVISIFSCGLVILLSGTRLVWAMSRDKRFPGWQWWSTISPKRGTPLAAAVFMAAIGELVLAIFWNRPDAMTTFFAAATLLPAMIYAGTVVMYLIKRKTLPDSMGFTLGRWEMPVIVLALIWLAFELSLFRDASFADCWLYVLAMFAVGAAYLGYLLIRHGRRHLDMPDEIAIDAVLDAEPSEVQETAG